jgi:hypothetical protein
MTAKFRDFEVYSFISSELCPCEQIIPLPITTVFARGIGSSEQMDYQYFHLYPLSCSNLSSAFEILSEFAHRLQRIIAGKQFFDTDAKIEQIPPTNIPSAETLEAIEHSIEVSHLWNGCLSIRGMSLARCLKLMTTVLEEDGEMLAVRPSIDCHSTSFVQIAHNSPSPNTSMSYAYLHPTECTSSIDTAETLLMLWKDNEMVSLEDPFHPRDRLAYQHFKLVTFFSLPLSLSLSLSLSPYLSLSLSLSLSHLISQRISETIAALRRDEAAGELAYAQKGIGMDEHCHLQIVIDQLCRTPEDLRQLHRDYPASAAEAGGGAINTVKVQSLVLPPLPTVTPHHHIGSS